MGIGYNCSIPIFIRGVCRKIEKIEIKNLYKIFGAHPEKAVDLLKNSKNKDEILSETKNVVGLNNVSLSIKSGEIFVIMGLSGSGKSTLARCINRLIEPTSGEIYIDGENITTMSYKELLQIRRNKIGMVFQNFALFPHLNLLDNVAYGLKVQGVPVEKRYEKASESLKGVGLSGWEKHYPQQLSGGMRQRVRLARALANDPDILLMDEAFSALDPLIRQDMQDELMNLQDKMNKTIVFITHDLNEALKLGDRIALMKDGKINQIGTPEEILISSDSGATGMVFCRQKVKCIYHHKFDISVWFGSLGANHEFCRFGYCRDLFITTVWNSNWNSGISK